MRASFLAAHLLRRPRRCQLFYCPSNDIRFSKAWKKFGEIFQCLEKFQFPFSNLG
jgi:hypothetical protein